MAKDPYTQETWAQYKHCPYENTELDYCFAGITAGGGKGGFFEYGHIKVKLNQSITLQGGFKGAGSEVEVAPAAPGYETLEAPELKVTGGIGVLSKQIQQEAKWPAALVESWKEAKKNKESAVNVKIEMAGNECFEVPGCLDTENILFEEGVAFRLPLKVKITSPWLEKLASGPCYIASDENPIHINLTTEDSGRSGSLVFNDSFTNIFLHDSKLVDTGWHIPKVSGANGCGGEYEAYVDKALNMALEVEGAEGSELSWKRGIVSLVGNLHNGNRKVGVLEEGVAAGEIP